MKTTIKEPNDWQLKVWRKAEFFYRQDKTTAEGEFRDVQLPSIARSVRHYLIVANWLESRTQESWETALKWTVLALMRDGGIPAKGTSIDYAQADRDRARKYAAQMFCAALGLGERDVIENG